jgi:hypothetical protein
MKVHSVKNRLPKDKEYVLVHITYTNWGDSDDPEGHRYWVVAKFERGITREQRARLPHNSSRKAEYHFGDEHGNNTKPYKWDTFGPSDFFGQEVDYWMRLPKVPKDKQNASKKDKP